MGDVSTTSQATTVDPSEPDSPAVSVPCPCGAAIRLQRATCPSCGAPVSPELREALEVRFEASHAEYREAKEQVRRSSAVLLVLALLHLGFGVLMFLVARSGELVPPTPEEASASLFSLVGDGIVGGALLACYLVARRAPAAGLSAALAVWLGVRLVSFAVAPASLLLSFLSATGIAALLGKVVVVVLLARGLMAARTLRRIQVQERNAEGASSLASPPAVAGG
jgi:hypothetical protein